MITRGMLGQTGIEVSRMGLGTVKFGRNEGVKYPTHFSLPTDKMIEELVSCAKELGVNLLDTAPAYGVSEERLGRLLKGARSEWIISTKVGETFLDGQSHFDFSSDSVRDSVLRSLDRLQTDYLDIVLIHSDGNDEKIIQESDVFSVLLSMKEAGWIRAIGMSTKTAAGALLALDYSDVVMIEYNPLEVACLPAIVKAYKEGKGIFIKKALASGHLQHFSTEDPVRDAMRFIFNEAGVSSVIVGTLNLEHLRYNAGCVLSATQF